MSSAVQRGAGCLLKRGAGQSRHQELSLPSLFTLVVISSAEGVLAREASGPQQLIQRFVVARVADVAIEFQARAHLRV